jgi:hypothetical protein
VAIVILEVLVVTTIAQPIYTSKEIVSLSEQYRRNPSSDNRDALTAAKSSFDREHLLTGLAMSFAFVCPTIIYGRRWIRS